MNVIHYIGLDVHKKTISFCVKTAAGQIVEQGCLEASRAALRGWAERRQQPWRGAMEATLFSAWIYDTLKPYAEELVMGHPARMKAITAGKKKSDSIDARTIADLLRCDLLPTCYVISPEMRDLRRLMRYRNLVVRQSVRMQNKMAGLLMESGTAFNKEKLHGKKYFTQLMESLEEVPESVKDLLRMSQSSMEMFESTQKQIQKRLLAEPILQQRVERLKSIRGVGVITALTWALEVDDPQRFSSIAHAVSYCGLTAAFRSSAGKQQRGPISKQRNAWLQTVLIEAAKLAPRWNPQMAILHAPQLKRGHANRASLQVARKLVAYLLAVDKSGKPFQEHTPPTPTPVKSGKRATKKNQKGSHFSASCLRETYAPTLGFGRTDYAAASFLRHADLSPDGPSRWPNTKGNRALRIPLRTHRWDESDRVLLAGCSSAEPASASSIDSAYQSFHVRSVSDLPAGPCAFRDCAREFRLPIHSIVCFKVGRSTLTQSSWTTLARRCSRKWMSGHAANALVAPKDRGQFGTFTIRTTGETLPPGRGESPFPLDLYLSWMSRFIPAGPCFS